MHGLTAQKTRGANPGRFAPLKQTTYQSAALHNGLSPDDTEGEDARIDALQRQLRPFGLSVCRMLGSELAVTGERFSRALPDVRCGWMLLRQLRGGAA